MSQHDYVIDNAAGAAIRSDLNNALAAIASQNSGATAPATTYAYMLWADTTTGWLKQRNAANSAWLFVAPLAGHAEADLASAATTDLGASTSDLVRITGTTTITSLGTADAGRVVKVRHAGALTLTHNATSLILPGGANITTAAGDTYEAVSLGSGNWTVRAYQRASGAPVVGSGITSGSMQASTSGTAITFGSIPAGTKRITVMFDEVSTNSGSTAVLLRLGDSGGIETTGYVSFVTGATSATDGFLVTDETNAGDKRTGIITLALMDAATNKWVASGSIGASNTPTADAIGGVKALSATLTQISITTSAGTATFDNGNINILYE